MMSLFFQGNFFACFLGSVAHISILFYFYSDSIMHMSRDFIFHAANFVHTMPGSLFVL